MVDHTDPESENVAERFRQATSLLSDAERIFDEETTAEHRRQWPNAYRLESATKYAQEVLSIADPRITRPPAAEEIVASATQARDAIRAAVDSGGGNLIESANRLLAAAEQINPGPSFPDAADLAALKREIETTRAKTESQIGEAATEVVGQKDQAFAAIKEAVDAVDTSRQAAEQQASELGLVTSAIASTNLAVAYAKVAKETEEQAKRYEVASLLTGILAIIVAGIGIYTAKQTSQVETFVARAALGIPVALFAAYINSLASTHRHEAWRLRHIELQIKTANPFLGLLATRPREDTLAVLALRFFPGQEGVSFDRDSSTHYTPEVVELLLKLLQQQAASGGHAPPAPPTTG